MFGVVLCVVAVVDVVWGTVECVCMYTPHNAPCKLKANFYHAVLVVLVVVVVVVVSDAIDDCV